MRFDSLDAWLRWQETLHPAEIELGLERVAAVWAALRPDIAREGFACPVITVAGTNGKGSSVAMLEAILAAAGYRVGVYTSPHLLRYNERVRVAGEEAGDEALCAAFERVDQARGATSLTYFEFGTLAALDIFAGAAPDALVLEVGMGGRLDAVNIVDPDVSLITAIGVDHVQWLGADRDAIAREKAGILRRGRPGIYSGRELPEGLVQAAEAAGAPLYVLGRDFSHRAQGGQWTWTAGERRRDALPLPALQGRHQLDNAAGVLMALACAGERLPLGQGAVRDGLLGARLPGRFQVLTGDAPGEPMRVLDVAHNAEAAAVLAAQLASLPPVRTTRAVVAMLADKDHAAVLAALADQVDHWYLADLQGARAASAAQLAEALSSVFERRGARVPVQRFDTVAAACAAALDDTRADARAAAGEPGERIVVFGSFYTVAEALHSGL